MKNTNVAVMIPCYNEAKTIKKVVNDFNKELPDAKIYVYDNNSTDDTAKIARKAGAIVRHEYLQGKGNVVRTMFNEIDADIYIMVDGDDTYPANEVHSLINPVKNGKADMVIGDRLSSTYYTENKRPFHNFGNTLVKTLINLIFCSDISDVMTGYRAFSKNFVKNMPVMSEGFQVETEMTAFALNSRMRVVSVPITYRDRPEGSFSKLNTFKDGTKVLLTIAKLTFQCIPMFACLMLAVVFYAIEALFGFRCYIPEMLMVAGLILEIVKGYIDKLMETNRK